MIAPTVPTRFAPAPIKSDSSPTPPLAHLELGERQVFGLAFVLHHHFLRAGPPNTPLQEDLVGLRDFLFDLLEERHIEVLLGRGA